ncbi:MAG: hypothetical protein A3K41_06710 [Chloroflexi bacterium RIFOXYD12_FULL_57_15]|nr:MAG: hypothetical protein A3K41_06710 [Chloroflexi bacterium RIFOXYD12_FULL_57_15]
MFVFKKMYAGLIAVGLLLTACGGQTAAKVENVTITLTEFGVKSSVTDFKVGIPYRFNVTNNGSIAHEIMLMPPLTEDAIGMGMDTGALDEMALAMIEADELTPGATKSFDYTFNETAPAGTLEFACHIPGHYEAGMNLPITVK